MTEKQIPKVTESKNEHYKLYPKAMTLNEKTLLKTSPTTQQHNQQLLKIVNIKTTGVSKTPVVGVYRPKMFWTTPYKFSQMLRNAFLEIF